MSWQRTGETGSISCNLDKLLDVDLPDWPVFFLLIARRTPEDPATALVTSEALKGAL